MSQNNWKTTDRRKWANISWVWVGLSFVFGAWPIGVILIILKIMGEEAQEEQKRENIRRAQQNLRQTSGTSSSDAFGRTQPYQDVDARPVKEKKAAADTQWQGSTYRSGAAASAERAGGKKASSYSPELDAYYAKSELLKLLNPKKGKGLQIAGWILLALAGLSGTMTLLENLAYGWLLEGLMGVIGIGFTIGLPGIALLAAGSNKRKRNARCRNHLAMIGNRRTVSLDEMDAASPGNFKTVCKDLEWMLGQGFFPGAYLDMGRRVFTYPGEQEPVRQAAPEKPKATTDAGGRRVYAEEKTIRELDDRIQDAYVSQRIQRLAQLTHQILAYVEENPAKETKIRQFRNHYLPKTISILEAYAKMERQNVSGANIRGAMADVEQIMDKLVNGFEKQLDALFDSEAMDVTTDINVLESMMNMEGLGDLDPFGSAAAHRTQQNR